MKEEKTNEHKKILTITPWYERKVILGISWKLIVFGCITGILLPILMSYITIQMTSNLNEKIEEKNLANGYISDLENVNDTLNSILGDLDNPTNPDYHKNAQRILRPLYPNWGLYYSNRQDIQKFDPKISNDLYQFYYILLSAEDARSLFNNYDILYPINPNGNIEAQQQNAIIVKSIVYNGVYSSMHECRDIRIPNLINELKRFRDS